MKLTDGMFHKVFEEITPKPQNPKTPKPQSWK
jgi:hypothetical protein